MLTATLLLVTASHANDKISSQTKVGSSSAYCCSKPREYQLAALPLSTLPEATTAAAFTTDREVKSLSRDARAKMELASAASTLSINDKSQAEFTFDGTADVNFQVSLSPASSSPVTVNYATSNGTATAGDYQPTSGTLTFNPGDTVKEVIVRVIADSLFEADETYAVNLSNPSGATITKGQGIGTITNDDTAPSVSIRDARVHEGNSGMTNATFSVVLSAASGLPLTVNFATSNGSASAGSDYQSVSGTLTLNGETTKSITVPVNGDTAVEPDETFFMNLSNPTNATIADNQGVGTILNDDGPPTISLNDLLVTEGNGGTVNATFSVSLSWASSQTVTVQYVTADGTATAGSDYQSKVGPLTFNPGDTNKTITVEVTGDTLNEPNETFFVNLSAATNATIADNQGIGTILNDDGVPTVVNGKVKSISTGAGLSAVVLAYQSDTNLITAMTFTNSLGQYTLTVPNGNYSFYARAEGYMPVEQVGVSVQVNTTLDFSIDNSVFFPKPPAFLTKAKFKDLAVYSGGIDSTSITLTSTTDLGPTVEVYNEYGRLAIDGQTLGKIRLYDDGTHGDNTPGDHIYSRTGIDLIYGRSGIGYSDTELFLRGGLLGQGFALYANITLPTAGIVSIPTSILIAVNPAFSVDVQSVDADAQFSRYAANVRMDPSRNDWQREAPRLFYQKFSDMYDFIFLFPNGAPPANLAMPTRNNALGIGQGVFDTSQTYGSSGRLQLVVQFYPDGDPPLLHETMHRWGAFLGEVIETQYPAHWGYTGVNGVLGGFDPSSFKDNGDGTYSIGFVAPLGWKSDTRKYAPLEMYLAGFTDNLAQLAPIPVVINPKLVNGNPNHFTADAIKYVTGQDIVTKYGVRNPAASQSQHTFRAAFIGVSDELLNPASMAYLSVLSGIYAGVVTMPNSLDPTLSFTQATSGLGHVDPTIVVGTQATPPPFITGLSPDLVVAGGQAFTLTVMGVDFINGEVVRWNGSDRPTTFVSTTQLTAAITAADIANAGTANVTVFNPTPGSYVSNVMKVKVNAVPVLASLFPHVRLAGGGGFSLFVTGNNFVNGSVVRWNGADRPTTFFGDPFSMGAEITAADIAVAGTAKVTVFNPGAGTSNALNFTINAAAPTLSINDVNMTEGNSGATLATFTVTLSGPSEQPVTVNYVTSNGTATAADYEPTTGSLFFFSGYPGETAKSVTVTVSGDSLFEPDETFFVNLSDASGAMIADNQGLGTIRNDDPAPQPGTVQFSSASYSQSEGAGAATITLTRAGGSSGAASVQFATTSGGTATGGASCTAGVDYINRSGTLNWIDGDANSKTFAVTLCNDNVFEGNETVNLTLSNGTGATLGGQTTATLTINEDDPAPPPLLLVMEESGQVPNEAAALDAVLFMRGPFLVLNSHRYFNPTFDPNTRVMIFVGNLQLAQGETSSAVVVNLVASNNQSYDLASEDVRSVPGFGSTQVIFRLPDNLTPGTLTIKVKAHGQVSNSGTMRIRI